MILDYENNDIVLLIYSFHISDEDSYIDTVQIKPFDDAFYSIYLWEMLSSIFFR